MLTYSILVFVVLLQVAFNPYAIESCGDRHTDAQVLKSLEPPEQGTDPENNGKNHIDVKHRPLVSFFDSGDVENKCTTSKVVEDDSCWRTDGKPLSDSVFVTLVEDENAVECPASSKDA